jgi:SsrA-binding protein
MKDKVETKTLHVNRVARMKYSFEGSTWMTCGVVLSGPDVKLAKDGQISVRDGYCAPSDGALWLHNATVGKDRKSLKLLVSKKEFDRTVDELETPGATVVPVEVIEVAGWVKLKVAVVHGRKKHDKRQYEKDKDEKKKVQDYKNEKP